MRWLALLVAVAALIAAKATVGLDVFPTLDRLTGGEDGAAIGDLWPDGEIRYFNDAPEQDWAVEQAVSAWNRSGAHVHFVATTSDRAQLTISSKGAERCGHGHATLGYMPRARTAVFKPGDGPRCDPYWAARVLAHELGHVLGLEHDDSRCAAMNASGNRRGSHECKPSPPWQWRCRLLEATDVRAAAKLYGGTPAPAREPADCNLYQPLRAPSGLRSLPERTTSDHLAFSFVRPANPVTPRFLHPFVQASYTFAFKHGACGERPESRRYRWSVGPGEEQVALYPILGGGTHCLRIWAVDELGRPSDTASTLLVDVP